MPIERATWGRRIEFSPEQRKDLCEILKISGEPARQFLDAIQVHAEHLVAEWRALVEIPPETPKKAAEVLTSISERAKALHEAVTRLDYYKSLPTLWRAYQARRMDATFLDDMEQSLFDLTVAAAHAVTLCSEPAPGRLRDDVERTFIAKVARVYRHDFKNARLGYSRGSRFPRFVARVLDIALPGNPHSGIDNSKIVKGALKDYKLIR